MRAERSEGIARRAEQAVHRATDVRESWVKQLGGLSPLEKSDRKLDKCGDFIMVYKVRICCGKSERAPRCYFALKSDIIGSIDDG